MAEITGDAERQQDPPAGLQAARSDTDARANGSPAERRRHPRHAVDAPAIVQILIEEATFSPFRFECVCQNISRSGALLVVRDLAKEIYLQMIRRPRFVRLGFNLPGRAKPIWLFGKLVWYDFKQLPEGTVCKLASSFEARNDEYSEELERYLESLAAESGQGGAVS